MTQNTTEIIATYPIYKPFRRENFYFKKGLKKELNKMQPNLLARLLPSPLDKLAGRKYTPVVEELNQFVFLSMETEEETFHEIEAREKIERRINKLYQNVAENTLDDLEEVIEEDPEFEASFKAIKDIANKTDVNLSEELSKLKGLASNVKNQIGTLFRESQMILWDLPGEQVDRIILGNEVINVDEQAEFDIGNVADELALASLAKHHIPLIYEQVKIIHQSTSILPEALPRFQEGFNNFKNSREQDLLVEMASIFLGKLLGIREPILLAQKQLKRYLTLQDDINLEAQDSGSPFIKNLYESMVEQSQIVEAIDLAEEIMSSLSDNAEDIRVIYNKIDGATITGNTSSVMEEFCKFVAKIYYDLEDFRFITEVFQDIPSFTSMGGGVAISSAGEEESITIPEGVLLSAQNIFKTFPLATTTVYALRGLDIEVNKGEFVVIMGPSGSGKTTLLNILSGIEEPDRGNVVVAGLDLINATEKELVKFRKETISFIYQAYNLLPNLKNRENVQLPADLGIKKKIGNKKNRARELLEVVGLGDYPKGYPLRLSGGQQQRVTIARSLMNEPEIIFADEPTGDLDTKTGAQVLDVLEKFHQIGVTIVVVTHDHNVAKRADRVIYMSDGKIVTREQARL